MKYRTGLVVGKFAPLTRGHEALIEHAASQCEELIVLSYTSADYGKYSDPDLRERWLTQFTKTRREMLNVKIAVLRDNQSFPLDEAPEEVHRQFCAQYLVNSLNTTVQAVFSSEEYGVGFAQYLQGYFNSKFKTHITVTAETFDVARETVSVSATQVRAMGFEAAYKANLISNRVRSDLVPRVLILGGESSGKSTLTKALADALNTTFALEYGREFWERRDGNIFFEDMEEIAKEQILIEVHQSRQAQKVLICDTSPLTTLFYSREMFGMVSPKLSDLAEDHKYDAIYICDNDIPFEQDGTRRDTAFREKAYDFYVKFCGGPPYAIIVRGTVEERVSQVITDLKEKGLV